MLIVNFFYIYVFLITKFLFNNIFKPLTKLFLKNIVNIFAKLNYFYFLYNR